MSQRDRATRCRPQLECLEGRDLPAAGVLDLSFGSGGHTAPGIRVPDVGLDVARQPDGKLVVAGRCSGPGSADFALVRVNHDGTLDTSFGEGGYAFTDFDGHEDWPFAVTAQADGKIVAAGSTRGFFSDFALARYNSDGTPDTTFGVAGRVVTDFGGVETAFAVAIQPDGKIVAAGSGAPPHMTPAGFSLARYNPDGSLDATFGGEGVVQTTLASRYGTAQAMALQADGKIVVAGLDRYAFGSFVLARYTPDGSLDPGFDGDGLAFTPSPAGFSSADLRAVAIRPDGKIVAGGVVGKITNSNADLALVRYNPDGSLDTGFGGGGVVTRDLGGDESIQAIALLPDGMVVAVGSRSGNSFVARFAEGGSPDASFGTDGWVMNDFAPGGNDHFDGVLLEPDGSLVAVETARGGATSTFLAARYLIDTDAPSFTSATGTTFTVGTAGEFLFTTTGAPSLFSLQGDLPRGLRFVDHGDGTASLGGTLAPGTAGLYELRLSAHNGVAPDARQSFLLRVREDRDPELVGVSVQGGQKQRPRLTFLDVAFTGPVRAQPGAFRLQQVGGGAVQLRQRMFLKDNGVVVVRLTFVTGNRIPNALGDGRYLLTVNGSRILGAEGLPLGGVTEVRFSRVYGDTDGDGTFDQLDLARLRRVLRREGNWRRWEALFAPVTDEDADRLAALIALLG